MTNETERDPQVEEARARLQDVATRLCARLSPLDVAGSFAGIAATILAETLGREKAATYLRDLGDALADDEDLGWGGRA
jgi:hypothetical protein